MMPLELYLRRSSLDLDCQLGHYSSVPTTSVGLQTLHLFIHSGSVRRIFVYCLLECCRL